MPRIKFANILLEKNPRSLSFPTLYCKANQPVIQDAESSEWKLCGRGSFDFTTYFNSLSVMKLRRYTSATRFMLHLEIKGSACEYVQTIAGAFDAHPVMLEETRRAICASSEFRIFDFDLHAPEEAVLLGFMLKTEGEISLGSCFYSVEVDHALRDVELVLATTTFKKEQFIKNNISLIRDGIINSNDEIANHFNMHVIDNGRTLDKGELESKSVHIHPNANVGGAGGFTYGMILAMEQEPKATHVLLMDDDVAVSPESIKRTYNLLKLVNNDYSDALVSGAMLNYEVGDEQWEDTGYMTSNGTFAPAKPGLRLTKFEDIVFNETFWIPKDIKEGNARYAAWWYCCIPIDVIEDNNLPLPYFVRCDDAEYGVRCNKPLMTMNGLGIWHMSFHVRYNAAVERYQTTRNTMIARYTTGFAKSSDFMHELHNNIRLELKKYGYENAELCLDAFEDFMKGPDFYSKPGIAEKTFMDANKHKEKLIPFAELEKEAHALGLTDFHIGSIDRQLIDSDAPRTTIQRLNDLLTDNNQRLIVNKGRGYAVIPVLGWAYPAGAIRGKEYLIVIDWYNKCGAIRKKDAKRFAQISERYKQDLKKFKSIEDELSRRYAASRENVTSIKFWKSYLGID